VADKLMQFAMLFVIILTHPLFLILIIEYALKEIILLAIGLLIYHKGYNLNGSNWAGKTCTVVFDTSMLIFIIFGRSLPYALEIFLICLVSVFLLIAFFSYLNAYIKLYRTHIKK
jgi:phosphatidylglycerophosphate synthase